MFCPQATTPAAARAIIASLIFIATYFFSIVSARYLCKRRCLVYYQAETGRGYLRFRIYHLDCPRTSPE